MSTITTDVNAILRDHYFEDEANSLIQIRLDEVYEAVKRFLQIAGLRETRWSSWDYGYQGFGICLEADTDGCCFHEPEAIELNDLSGLWCDCDLLEAYTPHVPRLEMICKARDKWEANFNNASSDFEYSRADARFTACCDAYDEELERTCADVASAIERCIRLEVDYAESEEGFSDWAMDFGDEWLEYEADRLESDADFFKCKAGNCTAIAANIREYLAR